MTNEPSERLPAPINPLRWIPRFREMGRARLRPQAGLLGLALVVGVAAGLGAIVFYSACHLVVHFTLDRFAGYHPQHPGGEPPLWTPTDQPLRPWMLLVLPTIGGLISGWIVFTFAPEAEGHGTDAAIAAFHFRQGRIRARVPFVKLIASAITIGTGGSGGREGPIAQIGAGFGSFVGQWLRLRPVECRTLMLAGVGAGIAAIFRAPLAGALFAAEILYRSTDIETEVIVPSALASTTAYCTFGMVFGWDPLFSLSVESKRLMTFHDPSQLIAYLVLALFVVVLAMLYTRTFYGITDAFRRLPVPRTIRPAIGAFASGAVGLALYFLLGENEQALSVLGAGYASLQDAFLAPEANGGLNVAIVLIAVALGKILTTSLTIGSGGSGGVFGPAMIIGGCASGALGIVIHRILPDWAPHPTSFVIVGMAGFFAAAAKTPLSTLVIVSEMTGDYGLLLPTLWVCVIAFLLSDEQSIYQSQVENRSLSPAHQGDYVREVLAGLQVGQFLGSQREFVTLRPGDSLARVVECLGNTSYQGLPVASDDGRYLGMVSLDQVHLASTATSLGDLVVAADLMRSDIPPLRSEERLDTALQLFIQSDQLALAVVDGSPTRTVVGIARRSDISLAYLRRVHGTPGEAVPIV